MAGPVNREEEILSKRELEVLKLLAAGLTYQQIARRLFVSRNTVKTHVVRINKYLGAGNTAHAVARAHTEGLLPFEVYETKLKFTQVEKRIMRLVAAGETRGSIARKMKTTERKISVVIESIFADMNASNAPNMVDKACRARLVRDVRR